MNENSLSNWKEYLNSIITETKTLDYIDALSYNPNITLKDVISNPSFKWSYYSLSFNESIPIDYILKTITIYPWNYDAIFQRINLSQLKHISSLRLNIDYEKLSRNNKIPFSYVLRRKNENWDWTLVVDHILTEYDYLINQEECDDIIVKYNINGNYICYINNLSAKFIYELFVRYKNNNLKINDDIFIYILSQKATLEFILNHNDFVWDWCLISLYNKTIKTSDIISHPELPWNYHIISYRIDMTISLYRYIKIKLSTQSLSSSTEVCISDVIDNSDIPWNYSNLYKNPNMT